MSTTRRALLIGSSYGGLQGVRSDVASMETALKKHDFEVQTLVDHEATRDGILVAYESLIAQTQRDDAAVVYYAGHGGYTDNPSATEGQAAEYHQYILPMDFGDVTPEAVASGTAEFRGIMDVELSHLQGTLTKATDNVVVILDCCHSHRMSRDEALPRGTRKAEEWTEAVDAFVRRLRAEDRVPEARYVEENPLAVRLFACAQDDVAYETAVGGFFTRALTEALGHSTGPQLPSWRQLTDHVRDLVMAGNHGQRPGAEGPVDRELFKAVALDRTDVLRLVWIDGEAILQGGSLVGVERGDEYLVMPEGHTKADPEHALAQVTVLWVAATTCGARVESVGSHGAPPEGSYAFLRRKNVRRGSVRFDGNGPLLEHLRQRVEDSTYLRVWNERDALPAMATVTSDGKGIHILDVDGAAWLEPSAAEEGSLGRVVQNLRIMARAEAMRRMEGGSGQAVLRVPPHVEWGCVEGGTARPLAATNERVRVGRDKVYVKVTNPAPTDGQPIYVSIFDIGLTGKVSLATPSHATGVQILPQEHAGVGLHPYRGTVGVSLAWAKDAPRRPRRESLVVIATDKPHDLRPIQGAGATRSSGDRRQTNRSDLEELMELFERGGTREMVVTSEPEYQRFFVKHIDFLVEPQGFES